MSFDFHYYSPFHAHALLAEGTPLAAEENFIHPALFALYTILAFAGIIFAIGCLIFNVIFRKKR